MNDLHFAELARDLKQDNGFVNWSVIIRWYNKHYLTVTEEQAHRYANDIMYLILDYVTRHGLINALQLANGLSPRFNAYTVDIHDLTDEYNSKMCYKIIATVCSKLILTEVRKIPHYNELP